jgi:hypothetical protein
VERTGSTAAAAFKLAGNVTASLKHGTRMTVLALSYGKYRPILITALVVATMPADRITAFVE